MREELKRARGYYALWVADSPQLKMKMKKTPSLQAFQCFIKEEITESLIPK